MKKILLGSVVIILIVGAVIAFLLFGPATAFDGKRYYFHIRTGSTYATVLDSLKTHQVINRTWLFDIVAKRLDYPEKVKAGRYEITRGSSILTIARMLRNGRQAPVNLVITKLRTREDLAALVGRKFETDSGTFMNFLNSKDSLSDFSLDSNTVMQAVMPNTYTYFWNTGPRKIFDKMFQSYQSFWTPERKQQAQALGLTESQVITLASIIEEETNKNDEKGNISSVYLNRLHKGMRLGADPTVKFALRDFGLKRIYNKYLTVVSPYNTYQVNGLPPGPICTPSVASIDAVLHTPATDYLYFVARSDFSGHHQFASTYEEHLQYAHAYQHALDSVISKKQSAGSSK